MRHPHVQRRLRILAGSISVAATLSLGVVASQARPNAQVTLDLQANVTNQPALDVLVPNFERVYPDIKVDLSYLPLSTLSQLETTELGAGNAPALLYMQPGCGGPISVCTLAKLRILVRIRRSSPRSSSPGSSPSSSSTSRASR